MLRKLIVGTIVANFVIMLVGVIATTDYMLPPSFAVNTTISAPAMAHVDAVLELISGGIRKIPYDAPGQVNPWDYPNSTAFDLGTLVYLDDEGYFIGQYWYCTLMIPVTSGRSFKITETGTALTGANGTINDQGYLVIPDYNWDDEIPEGTPQEGPPAGAYCAPPNTAVGTHDVYVDPVGEVRIVRGIIAISGPPAGESYPRNYSQGYDGSVGMGTEQFYTDWEPVDINTPPGDYSGQVTFTLTLT